MIDWKRFNASLEPTRHVVEPVLKELATQFAIRRWKAIEKAIVEELGRLRTHRLNIRRVVIVNERFDPMADSKILWRCDGVQILLWKAPGWRCPLP